MWRKLKSMWRKLNNIVIDRKVFLLRFTNYRNISDLQNYCNSISKRVTEAKRFSDSGVEVRILCRKSELPSIMTKVMDAVPNTIQAESEDITKPPGKKISLVLVIILTVVIPLLIFILLSALHSTFYSLHSPLYSLLILPVALSNTKAVQFTKRRLDSESHFAKADITGFILYDLLIKIGLIQASLALVVFVVTYALFPNSKVGDIVSSPLNNAFFILAIGGMFLLFYIFTIEYRKEVRFYYAKTCIKAISQEPEISQKIKYLTMGLNQYNKYLLRKLKLKINDVNQIISKFMSDSKVDMDDSIEEILRAYKDDKKLEPITTIKGLLSNTNPEEFLVRDPFGATIQTWGNLIAAVISAVAAVLALKVL
jgi:hypothetical protein